jgi:hypothetical protein
LNLFRSGPVRDVPTDLRVRSTSISERRADKVFQKGKGTSALGTNRQRAGRANAEINPGTAEPRIGPRLFADPTTEYFRICDVMRDYGMYERTEAPQYYPPVKRGRA